MFQGCSYFLHQEGGKKNQRADEPVSRSHYYLCFIYVLLKQRLAKGGGCRSGPILDLFMGVGIQSKKLYCKTIIGDDLGASNQGV